MDYKALENKVKSGNAKIGVVGIGYVGLPLLLAFSRAGFKTIGFDVNKEKINGLLKGNDITMEYGNEKLKAAINTGAKFTDNPAEIKDCDIIIICVPTPVKDSKEPDMGFVRSAAELVGENLNQNSLVILESTVYPGATEEIVIPVIERKSGLKCGRDFSAGYSPERVNVGDREHTLEMITKVVSGFNEETTDIVDGLYKKIIKAGTFKARNMKTAEAAKSIENIQRDLNIALVNELALIFERLGIDIMDVLEASGTKWNFVKFYPGLVGGHCIPEDPYFLVHKAKRTGYNPQIILAGRDVNNFMSLHTVNLLEDGLKEANKGLEGSKVLLLGLTFKKNVRDVRNTPVKEIINELIKSGATVFGFDPLVIKEKAEKSFGIKIVDHISDLKGIDCIALLTDHDIFRNITLDSLAKVCAKQPVMVDVRRFFSWEKAREAGFIYLGFGFKPAK